MDITVGVIAKPQPSSNLPILEDLVGWLGKKQIRYLLDPEAGRLAGVQESKILERQDLPKGVDLLVVLGGDGTLLSVARHCNGLRLPILGVNLGHLGYLTEISTNELFPVLDKYLAGTAVVQTRMMLRAVLRRRGENLAEYHCLNDVVLNKAALARIIEIRVRVSGLLLTTLRADGLIVSTPTGSTAYNLSAGGPILTPGMNGMIINPICPHALTLRPIVVDGGSRVEIDLPKETGEVYLTADGQLGLPVKSEDTILVEKSPHALYLVAKESRSHFALLREKLGWGGKVP